MDETPPIENAESPVEQQPKKVPFVTVEMIAVLCLFLLLVSALVFFTGSRSESANLGIFRTINNFIRGESLEKDYTNQTKIELESEK